MNAINGVRTLLLATAEKGSGKASLKNPDRPEARAKKRKKLKNPQDKVETVMKEFKRGTLRSGSGEIVTDRKQALAIAMSEAGLSKAESVERLSNLLKAKKGEMAVAAKYYRRIPKPGGGYKYYYTKQSYQEAMQKEKKTGARPAMSPEQFNARIEDLKKHKLRKLDAWLPQLEMSQLATLMTKVQKELAKRGVTARQAIETLPAKKQPVAEKKKKEEVHPTKISEHIEKFSRYNGGWVKEVTGLDKSTMNGFSIEGSFISPTGGFHDIRSEKLYIDCSIDGSRKNQEKQYTLFTFDAAGKYVPLYVHEYDWSGSEKERGWAMAMWPHIEKHLGGKQ